VNGGLPARVRNVSAARARYGTFIDRFLPALMRADPLADDVAADLADLGRTRGRTLLSEALAKGIDTVADAPASLHRLFESLDHVPDWVDWDAIERAGTVLFRTGFAGGTVLGAKSLVTGYCSPAGNKPLIFSGQLEHRERIGYRLAETSRFVVDVCKPGGMRRHGDGFAATVRVRVMHAVVRRLLGESGKFDAQRWGLPINQHDMAATTLLFSLSFLDGVRAFGFRITEQEAADYLHLWRYNGYVIGVEEGLLCATEREARRMSECIELTQHDPDEDARSLIDALVRSPLNQAGSDPAAQATARRQVWLGYGFTRTLLGDTMADKLELPKTRARFVLPNIARVVSRMEKLGRRIPGYDTRLMRLGQSYWDTAIEQGLQGKRATFTPPVKLAGLQPEG